MEQIFALIYNNNIRMKHEWKKYKFMFSIISYQKIIERPILDFFFLDYIILPVKFFLGAQYDNLKNHPDQLNRIIMGYIL